MAWTDALAKLLITLGVGGTWLISTVFIWGCLWALWGE